MAVNVEEVLVCFKDKLSHEKTDVEIITQQRVYKKSVSVQTALSSLMGIYRVTSGCLIMDKLRPMVKIHLPFASLTETSYRSISVYLMAQYFRHRRGMTADWDIKGLPAIYDAVQIVNRDFNLRITSLQAKDAGRNAVTQLDCYGQFTHMILSNDRLNDVEKIFESYFYDP